MKNISFVLRWVVGIVLFAGAGGYSFGKPDESAVTNVTHFGAKPDDGLNDAAALRAAAKFAREHPGTTLVFPPGQYDLRDEDAVKLENEVMSGKYGKIGKTLQTELFRPYRPYVRVLDFSGATNLAITATGATLMCDGWMEPVTFENCDNVTLTGLSIDYKRKPFSEGKVIAVREGSFDVKFDAAYPVTETTPMLRVIFWDLAKKRVMTRIFAPRSSMLGPQTVRFHEKCPPDALGNLALLAHCFCFRPAILINESSDVRFNDVAIYTQPGNGIVGNRSRNITLVRLKVVPPPGCHHSVDADATHFTNCTGLLRYDACECRGQGDDMLNVHNYYQIITKRLADNQCEAKVPLRYTHACVLDDYRVGETIELVDRDTLKTVRTYKVIAGKPFPSEWRQVLTLDDKLPSDTDRYYLMNATCFPRLEVVNCKMDSHLGRSALVKTRHVLIENCVMDQCTGTGIQVGAEANWKEGGPCEDLVIRNCRIIRCGRGGGTQHGAAGIAITNLGAKKIIPGTHRKILIENNVIEGEDAACGIYIGGADDLTVRNNRITGCRTPVVVKGSTNVRMENNGEGGRQSADDRRRNNK